MDYWSVRISSEETKKSILSSSKASGLNISDYINYIISLYICELYNRKIVDDALANVVMAKYDKHDKHE